MALSQTLGINTPDNLIVSDKPTPITRKVLVVSGQGELKRGAVVGRVRYSCPTTGTVAGTGNGTSTLVKAGAKVKIGSYVATCQHVAATFAEFNVVDPDGLNIGSFTIGVATGDISTFSSEQISFIVTNGSTDFIATDTITIAVTSGVPTTGTFAGTGNGTLVQVESRTNTKIGAYTATLITAITNGGLFTVANPSGVSLGTIYASKFTGTGNGTLTEIKAGPRFKKNGPYIIACSVAGTTHGGTFTVTDPDGTLIGTVVMPDTASGTAIFNHEQISFKLTDGSANFTTTAVFTLYWFESDELAFVIWDGSTDFAVSAVFTITTTIGANNVKLLNVDNLDGSQEPFGILAEAIDATSAAVEAGAYIAGSFNEAELFFGGNDTINTHRTALRDIGILTDTTQKYPTENENY